MTSPDSIDPDLVPGRALSSGVALPAIGLGTFGSDHVPHQRVADAVVSGVRLGYRHIDCASVYGNESHIGRALSTLQDDGFERDDLWVSSKLWNDSHDNVGDSCRRTLDDLGLDHLDMYLVHWPFPNYHPPHCDVETRSPDAKPYDHDKFAATWQQMEALVEEGLVRHIGTSNMTVAKLDVLLTSTRIAPSVNQMELHPHFQQPELLGYLGERRIQPIGFCPLGSPARPERDTTPDDTEPMSDPVVTGIAADHGVHPSAVCLRWAVQRGHIPIPFSTDPGHQLANLRAVTELALAEHEMTQLMGIDRRCRLIKGQVFLWREGQSWEDLWDVDGVIAR